MAMASVMCYELRMEIYLKGLEAECQAAPT